MAAVEHWFESCSFSEWTSLDVGFCPLTDSWVWHFTSLCHNYLLALIAKYRRLILFFFAIHFKHLQKSLPSAQWPLEWLAYLCRSRHQMSTTTKHKTQLIQGGIELKREESHKDVPILSLCTAVKGKCMCTSGCKCAVADAPLTVSDFKSRNSALIFSPPALRTSGKTEGSQAPSATPSLPPQHCLLPSLLSIPLVWTVGNTNVIILSSFALNHNLCHATRSGLVRRYPLFKVGHCGWGGG